MALQTILTNYLQKGFPITVADYMQLALQHPQHGYYTTRSSVGVDFTTAPEISPLFNLCIANWVLKSIPNHQSVTIVELGPGKGTLLNTVHKALNKANQSHRLYALESSPLLRANLQKTSPVTCVDQLSHIPTDQPLIIIANEFFDALPTRQLICCDNGWCERLLALNQTDFMWQIGQPSNLQFLLPENLGHQPNDLYEYSPLALSYMDDICHMLQLAPIGQCLICDYGTNNLHDTGDTLQALHKGQKSDPLHHIGQSDLTVHVNFALLKQQAQKSLPQACINLSTQAQWLKAQGINDLLAQIPDSNHWQTGYDRIMIDMDPLFKTLQITV
jgi:NADH dehydrogenase [ubiquinone] 1 alpha subcomplex assembly factor 7